jgi:separase
MQRNISPSLVACLWDVTDNELDKFSRSVFESLKLDVENVNSWSCESRSDSGVSLVTAVGQSRDACKLKYLTGAAPVVYGIPFYL